MKQIQLARIDGRAIPCPGGAARARRDLFVSNITHLYPLVGAGVVLRHVGTRREGKRHVELIEVREAKGSTKALLGFDAATKLLYSAQSADVVNGATKVKLTKFLSFQKVKGAKVPLVVEEYVNGRRQGKLTFDKLIPGKVDRSRLSIPR